MASNDQSNPTQDHQPSYALNKTEVSSTNDSNAASLDKHHNNDETVASSEDTSSNEKQDYIDGNLNEVAAPESEVEYPKAATLFFILLALALSIFLVSLDMTIIATAIPRITDEFHSLNDVGWYGTAFFLTLAR